MKLSGEQTEALCTALGKAFTLQELDQMLFFRLEKDREALAIGDDKAAIVFKLVRVAQRNGWIAKLVAAARWSKPDSPDLIAVEESIGFGTIGSEAARSLEKLVRRRWNFTDIALFRERFGRIENCVCAIETGSGLGTGFLVGPDLVLTNYHVVKNAAGGSASQGSIRCRFDYKAVTSSNVISAGREVALARDGIVAFQPYSQADLQPSGGEWKPHELDYALLRLSEKIGDQPIGPSAEPGATLRGWIPVGIDPPSVEKTDPLLIVQHPQDLDALPAIKLKPMQLAIGAVLEVASGSTRVRHDASTLPGSSGSPCCNANLELVALHQAGDPKDWPDYKGTYNQAIPVGAIIADLQAQARVERFWDTAPVSAKPAARS